MSHNLDYRCPIRAYRSSFYLCICAVALFTRINFHIHNYKLFCSINSLFFLHPFPNPPIHSFCQFAKQTSRSCPDTSALRAFLRRGIYHSHILEIRSFESMPALSAFECRISFEHISSLFNFWDYRFPVLLLCLIFRYTQLYKIHEVSNALSLIHFFHRE